MSTPRLVTTVDRDLMDLVLSPYKPDCRYLHAAEVAVYPEGERVTIEGRGRFSIERSAYIADTGHFNTVEFIVCMNQLGYVTIAETVVKQLAYPDQLGGWTLATFLERQLPNVLILKVEAKMRSQIDPADFSATMRCEAVRRNGETILISFSLAFFDRSDGRAEGSALIALTPPATPPARRPAPRAPEMP